MAIIKDTGTPHRSPGRRTTGKGSGGSRINSLGSRPGRPQTPVSADQAERNSQNRPQSKPSGPVTSRPNNRPDHLGGASGPTRPNNTPDHLSGNIKIEPVLHLPDSVSLSSEALDEINNDRTNSIIGGLLE